MAESIDHQKLLDAFAELGDAAITYVTKTFPVVKVTVPKTAGDRMQEMEWEIAGLQKHRDELIFTIGEWEQRWERIRILLVAYGLAIDDDTPEDHVQKLTDALADRAMLRDRTRSQETAIERLRNDLTNTWQELTNLRNTHHEWVNGQREKPLGLSETIQRMNDVITQQIETMSPTSGTGKVVDIRRRRLAEHTIREDVERLDDESLIKQAIEQIEQEDPEWLLEAAALLIAHYDAMQMTT